MKKLFLASCFVIMISCKKESQEPFGKSNETIIAAKAPAALGKEIFEGKGNCVACHQVAEKVIGPSIQDIAKIYKEKNGNIVSFLKQESEPIVDPSQYEVMKTNFVITKTMSDAELKGLEAYILSYSK